VPKVLWSEMLPYEFKERLEECPIVYLPMGICEPHGQISALGLDMIKADYMCAEAARRFGGIVAPSLAYHIHEVGYHSPWLETEVGENNPRMTGMPPDVVLRFFLYQLRAFVNAGFKGIVVLSGHSGGNQADLRVAAELFQGEIPIPMWVGSDPELVQGLYNGDHAGKYEISQLMHIRLELIDKTRKSLQDDPNSGGRLALGADADEASPELGQQIIEASLLKLREIVAELADASSRITEQPMVHYDTVEKVWTQLAEKPEAWRSSYPYPGQQTVSEQSRWKSYEYFGQT
jgi:creatinine amidohydrolase